MRNEANLWKKSAAYGLVLGELLGLTGGGGWLGAYLDKRWHTSPYLALLGGILGLACVVWRLIEWQKRQGDGKSTL